MDWAPRRGSRGAFGGGGGGQGEWEGKEVHGVGASGAVLEGQAAQGAAVEANARGVVGRRGARVGRGTSREKGRWGGLQLAEEASARAAGVVRERVPAGEHGSPSDGGEVGGARGGEGVGQGE